jgi:hypothetical protein
VQATTAWYTANQQRYQLSVRARKRISSGLRAFNLRIDTFKAIDVHVFSTQTWKKRRGPLHILLVLGLISLWNMMTVIRFVSKPLCLESTIRIARDPDSVDVDEDSLARTPRTALAMGRKRPTSSHFCIQPRHMHPIYRSCHFTDVCFSPAGGSFPVPWGKTATLVYITDTYVTAEELKTSIARVRHNVGPNMHDHRVGFFLEHYAGGWRILS